MQNETNNCNSATDKSEQDSPTYLENLVEEWNKANGEKPSMLKKRMSIIRWAILIPVTVCVLVYVIVLIVFIFQDKTVNSVSVDFFGNPLFFAHDNALVFFAIVLVATLRIFTDSLFSFPQTFYALSTIPDFLKSNNINLDEVLRDYNLNSEKYIQKYNPHFTDKFHPLATSYEMLFVMCIHKLKHTENRNILKSIHITFIVHIVAAWVMWVFVGYMLLSFPTTSTYYIGLGLPHNLTLLLTLPYILLVALPVIIEEIIDKIENKKIKKYKAELDAFAKFTDTATDNAAPSIEPDIISHNINNITDKQ